MNILSKKQYVVRHANIHRQKKHILKKYIVQHTYRDRIKYQLPLSSLNDFASVESITYFMGKSITLFTMFYCSLNWWYYKSIRKEHEKHKD